MFQVRLCIYFFHTSIFSLFSSYNYEYNFISTTQTWIHLWFRWLISCFFFYMSFFFLLLLHFFIGILIFLFLHHCTHHPLFLSLHTPTFFVTFTSFPSFHKFEVLSLHVVASPCLVMPVITHCSSFTPFHALEWRFMKRLLPQKPCIYVLANVVTLKWTIKQNGENTLDYLEL